MLSNLVVIAIVAIGIILLSLVAIILLSKYAGKHQNVHIEVFFKIFGCSFGAKASAEDGDKEENVGKKSAKIIQFKRKD